MGVNQVFNQQKLRYAMRKGHCMGYHQPTWYDIWVCLIMGYNPRIVILVGKWCCNLQHWSFSLKFQSDPYQPFRQLSIVFSCVFPWCRWSNLHSWCLQSPFWWNSQASIFAGKFSPLPRLFPSDLIFLRLNQHGYTTFIMLKCAFLTTAMTLPDYQSTSTSIVQHLHSIPILDASEFACM